MFVLSPLLALAFGEGAGEQGSCKALTSLN